MSQLSHPVQKTWQKVPFQHRFEPEVIKLSLLCGFGVLVSSSEHVGAQGTGTQVKYFIASNVEEIA